MQQTTDVVFSDHAFWLLTTGTLVPLLVYWFNHHAEGLLERVVGACSPNSTRPAGKCTQRRRKA
jgi:hypothetical protein